jgi:hypothetical protein
VWYTETPLCGRVVRDFSKRFSLAVVFTVPKAVLSRPVHVKDVPTCVHCTRLFKYDRDYLCVNKPVTVPVVFEPPCTNSHKPTNK